MGEAKRKSYTAAFKGEVGLEAIRGVKTINEIGQAYGVHPAQAEQLFTTKRGPKKADGPGDTEQLYNKIGRLEVELDWLKEKSGLSL